MLLNRSPRWILFIVLVIRLPGYRLSEALIQARRAGILVDVVFIGVVKPQRGDILFICLSMLVIYFAS